jgi:glycosyltransferase involved in cell wall biosynthesis
MKLIIQIPCYNEEETLELAYNDLPRHIDGVDTIEYLIINDGSKDGTVKRARELGFHHIVSFKQNKGLAKGFMAGIDACLHLGADIIVNTDADNQYCGADIEKIVRPILEEKADIVIGERPIDETEHFMEKEEVPAPRKLGGTSCFGNGYTRCAQRLQSLFAGCGAETECGERVYIHS